MRLANYLLACFVVLFIAVSVLPAQAITRGNSKAASRHVQKVMQHKAKHHKITSISSKKHKNVQVRSSRRGSHSIKSRHQSIALRHALRGHASKGDALIAIAKQYLGLKYRRGGTSPSTGFDCSGFVQWVYGKYGVKIPRSTWEQQHYGVTVSKTKLKPGDIVVFRVPGSYSGLHSGIYVGHDSFIHSPSTGKSISITPLSSGYFQGKLITARRVI